MTRKAKTAAVTESADGITAAAPLLADLRRLIDAARQTAAHAVNASFTLMYWRMEQRIFTEVLGGQRASYGDEIVSALSRQLTLEYGRILVLNSRNFVERHRCRRRWPLSSSRTADAE